MTPAKGSMPDADRNVVLQQIAKVAKRQGAWQLAAKKFTQVRAGRPKGSHRCALAGQKVHAGACWQAKKFTQVRAGRPM